MQNDLNRRKFLKTAGTAGTGALAARYISLAGFFSSAAVPDLLAAETDKPVKLGGKPVRTAAFPAWPIIDETEEHALVEVLKSK